MWPAHEGGTLQHTTEHGDGLRQTVSSLLFADKAS